MEYKISEILNEIKASIPEDNYEEIYQANRSIFNRGIATSILEAEGLLYMDEDGRRPTEYGLSKGITEEMRVSPEGEEYCQVLYSDRARDLVRAILFREYPALDPDREFAFIHRVAAHFPGTGIHAAQNIASEFPGSIIIMYCAPIYRAYEESADAICWALGLDPYVTPVGTHGVKILPGDLEQVVIPRLLNGHRRFIVNGENEAHIYTAVRRSEHQAEPARQERGKAARYGMCVEKVDQRGEAETVYLAAREHSREIKVHLADGTIVVTKVPITEKDGVQILSPESPLSKAIVGCRENSSFTFNGLTYRIRRVFRSESVNENTIG